MATMWLICVVGWGWRVHATVAPVPLAVRDGWAAFVDERPPRCWAVTRPQIDGRARGEAAMSVVVPRRGALPQLHVRLVRPRAEGADATLEIGGRRFRLIGQGAELWAATPAADRAILSLVRRAGRAFVVTRGRGGGVVRHRFAVAGAPTAIDAAILACR